jgi:hypothetical protein
MFELKAEYGAAPVDTEIHLWHVVQAQSTAGLCGLELTPLGKSRPVSDLPSIFPERMCSRCRKQYDELLPLQSITPVLA